MNKPYIVCHMMTAIDGRIDCGMTAKLPGTDEYYTTLKALDTPTTVSGRVTAQLEMAEEGVFDPQDSDAYDQEGFAKNREAAGYDVVVDTKGTLLWKDQAEEEKPVLVITSQQVSRAYLAYLDAKHISWIVCGRERIDLARAAAILADAFGVQRMAIVGGGTINAGFLAAGLLDEVSILLAPGIDGRKGMGAAFDGLAMETEPFILALDSVTPYDNGAVWLRYEVQR